MLNLLDDIDPADIIAFTRAVPFPDDYLLTRPGTGVLPTREINNIRYQIRSSVTRRIAAKYRAWDGNPVHGKRQAAHKVLEGFLPPLGQRLVVNELETIILALSQGADVTDDLLQRVYDDAEAHVSSIRQRLELAAGDALVDGVFTLEDENGLNIEADYEIPVDYFPDAGETWDDDESTPIDDELAWIKFLRKKGKRVGRIVTSDRIWAILGANAQYRRFFYSLAASVDAPVATLTSTDVNSVRARMQLPPIETYDATVEIDDDDGTQRTVRPIPDNRYLLLPARPQDLGETQMGITAESLALSRGSNPHIEREDAPGIIVTAEETDTPVRVWTTGSAVGMPVLYDRAFMCATVLAAGDEDDVEFEAFPD